MSDYDFKIASIDTLWSEGKELFARHFVEISHRPDLQLAPDIQGFRLAEERGHVMSFSARKDGVLVGYAIFTVQRALLFAHMEAVCSMIFISPEHRGFGGQFISYIDEKLLAEGIAEVYHHVPAKKDFSPLLARKGYDLVDRVFVKRLI